MKKGSNNFYPNYFTYPAIVLFTIFFLIPILLGFVMSFTDWNMMRLYKPEFNGLDNFIYLFEDDGFIVALKNTIIFGIITTIFIVTLGLGLSLILNKAIMGKGFFRTLFYLPAILSLIVVGIMFTAIFKMNGGVLNNILKAIGLDNLTKDWLGDYTTAMGSIIFVQIWKWSGFAMAIFLAGLQGISKTYYEASRIDGATKFQQLKAITLPLLAPAFTVVITMNVIGGFKVFEQVYVMTGGGPGNSTQVLSTYIYKAFSKGMLGRSTAMGLILFLMITVIALFINKALRNKEVDM